MSSTLASLKRRLARIEAARAPKVTESMIAEAAAIFDKRVALLIARADAERANEEAAR